MMVYNFRVFFGGSFHTYEGKTVVFIASAPLLKSQLHFSDGVGPSPLKVEVACEEGVTLRMRLETACKSREIDKLFKSSGVGTGIFPGQVQEWSGVCVLWSLVEGLGKERMMNFGNIEEHTYDLEELNVPKPRLGRKT
jgi:hypothetical protein